MNDAIKKYAKVMVIWWIMIWISVWIAVSWSLLWFSNTRQIISMSLKWSPGYISKYILSNVTKRDDLIGLIITYLSITQIIQKISCAAFYCPAAMLYCWTKLNVLPIMKIFSFENFWKFPYFLLALRFFHLFFVEFFLADRPFARVLFDFDFL